jgi:hypothetical protein
VLVSQPAARHPGFRVPLTQAEVAIGRFFFIQRAQAVVGDSRMQTFEFLHATFGEYLAARLAVQLAVDLLGRRSPLMVGAPAADDDLLYALLSFAPLSSRQVLRFVTSMCKRLVPDADRRRPELSTATAPTVLPRSRHPPGTASTVPTWFC